MGFPVLKAVDPALEEIKYKDGDGDDGQEIEKAIISIRELDNGFILVAEVDGVTIEEVYIRNAPGELGNEGLINSIREILDI
ncbi:MAG: hypothetical protein MOGMAGMI_00338 [Candidatus Omnitrophica bacterium]|nr:hypothetical protein [Candidatus Omnitrophota bacterium]